MTGDRPSPGPERITLRTNAPVPADGPARLVAVLSGSLDLSTVAVREDGPAGPRRHLLTIRRGGVAFLFPAPGGDGTVLQLLAATDAELAVTPLSALRRAPELDPALVHWTDLVFGLLPSAPVPRDAEGAGVGGMREPASGESLAAPHDAPAYVTVIAGELRLMGAEHLILKPDPRALPLAPGAFLTATEESRVRIDLSPADRDGALALLDEMLRTHLETVGREAARSERDRIRDRSQRHARATESALGELASVLSPGRAPVVRTTPLLTAAAEVGRSLGVEIRPPPPSENVSHRLDPVIEIARASRLRHRHVLLEGDWWREDAGPLLAFGSGEERRPLALIPGPRRRYWIHDPVEGARIRVTRETADRIAPQAMMFYRPLPPGPLGLADLLRFSLSGRKGDLVRILLAGLAATLLGMLTPIGVGVLMDQAIPDANLGLLLQLGLVLAVAAVGRSVFALSQGFAVVRFGISSEAATQAALWDRLLSLPASFFRGQAAGDLQSRAMAASEVGREVNAATLRSAFAAAMALLNLVLLFAISPSLAVIAIAVAVVALAGSAWAIALIGRRFRALLDASGRLYGFVVQLVSGVSKLRVAGAEGRAYTHWIRSYTEQVRLTFETQRIQDHVTVLNAVLPSLGTLALFWLGFGRLAGADASKMSVGTFLAFHTAFAVFLAGATNLSNTMIGLLDTAAKARRMRPILEAVPEVDEEKAHPGRLSGGLGLEDVSFRYREDGPRVLDRVNLKVEPGEMVAIVGPSGGGKSTVFRLLLGFELPEAGVVLYDDQDLAGLDVNAVRRQLGVVLQGGRLSAGSIFDNIAAGNAVTLDEAWRAAEDAGIAAEIRQMPMGLHTVISAGGGGLSGGQRQRVLIARSLVLRPRILLLDEATSALDNRAQEIVTRSLARRHVSRLVVAHRLSTIRAADRIFVLVGGKIVEVGSFAELSRGNGPFAQMMDRQIV